MKQLFIIILVFAQSIPSWGQDPELASMHARLKDATKSQNKDSLAIIYNDLGQYYSYRDPDSTKFYSDLGLSCCNKEQESPYIDLLNTRASYYNAEGDNKQSLATLHFAKREADRLGANNIYKGNILSSIGVGYRRLDMPDSALIYYNKALRTFEQAGEEGAEEIPFLMTNISILYANTGRLVEAEKYVREAFDKSLLMDDVDTKMYVMNTAGAILTLQNKFDDAAKLMLQSIEQAEKDHKDRFVLQCTSSLLNLYLRTQNMEALNKLVGRIQPTVARLPQTSNEVLGYYEILAQIYHQAHRYLESARLNEHLLKLHQQNAHTPLDRIYLNLARNHTALGRSKKASDYYEKAYETADSIHHSLITEQMSQFSVQFETQKKDLQIAQLKQEKLAQENRLIKWLFLGLFSLLLIVLWILHERQRRKQMRQQNQLDVARSFIEGMERERSRLAKELHDGVCNDLLGIGMMLNLKNNEQPELIVEQVERIREEVRSISHELMPPRFKNTSLDELLLAMFDKIATSSSTKVQCSIEDKAQYWRELPEQVAYELYRIIQELTSNIQHHAHATKIDFRINITETEVKFILENDGVPFDANPSPKQGIGLKTIEERSKSIGANIERKKQDKKQIFCLDVKYKIEK